MAVIEMSHFNSSCNYDEADRQICDIRSEIVVRIDLHIGRPQQITFVTKSCTFVSKK